MGQKKKPKTPKTPNAANYKKRKNEKSPLMTQISNLTEEEFEKEWKCINSIRCLGAAQPQNANSGHPGAPMGLAGVAHVLWTYIMNYSPSNDRWWNRDRFVLSNGHACALQYAMLYLTRYKNFTIEDLKTFRQLDSKTPGHPENHCTAGVEVTTGPLGQGLANAVGMAIAATHLAEEFNKKDVELFTNYIYVVCGDGCLQEGISSEACSLAGHLGLRRLILIYDSNHVTIDGSTDLAFTENVATRFTSYNWHVQVLTEKIDNDFISLMKAIEKAKSEHTRPSLIIATTTIAYGSINQGHHKTHGAPLGLDDVKQLRKKLNIMADPSVDDNVETFDLFRIDQDVLDYYDEVGRKGEEKEKEWNENVWGLYKEKYPEDAENLQRRFTHRLPENWQNVLPHYSPSDKGKATRAFSGIALNSLVKICPEIIGGSADLTDSNRTQLENQDDFSITQPSGRYIRFGIREHAMIAITSGIFSYGAFRPFAATFLNFVMYGWAAMRLAALSRFGTLTIASHDSIEMGEDGPTHQPIEVLSILRSTPFLIPIRPADGNEVSGAYRIWLRNISKPTIILLSRSEVPCLEGTTIEDVEKGAYLLSDFENNGGRKIVLASSGSEVQLIVQARKKLKETLQTRVDIRIVSMPSWNLYAEQSLDYQLSILPTKENRHRATTHGQQHKIDGALYVEASSKYGWDRFFDVDESVGMVGFGASASKQKVWEKFGFTVENIVAQTEKLLIKIEKRDESESLRNT